MSEYIVLFKDGHEERIEADVIERDVERHGGGADVLFKKKALYFVASFDQSEVRGVKVVSRDGFGFVKS